MQIKNACKDYACANEVSACTCNIALSCTVTTGFDYILKDSYFGSCCSIAYIPWSIASYRENEVNTARDFVQCPGSNLGTSMTHSKEEDYLTL